jgi:quercetin dioxygenase-like cupin family protein
MKEVTITKKAKLAVLLSAVTLAITGIAGTAGANNVDHGANVTSLFSAPLSNAPGERLTVLMVTYAPGAASPAHHHAGSVFAYVLSGVIRSENSATGPAENYAEGQSFFEPAGSEHMISANASTTKPARLLVIFVAPENGKLTTYDKASPSQ